jgi:3-oxoacyl-[acyl-carrier-protein] synthase III
MTTVSLLGTASYLPARVVDNDFFGLDVGSSRGAMFRGTRLRHHIADDETAVSMIERAAARLGEQLGADAIRGVELILTNVSLPDLPFTGCGASVARALGVRPRVVVDLHNTGCVSFIYMMKVASALIRAGEGTSALLCNVQTLGGRVFSLPGNRTRPQSAVPGDGCGVGLVAASAASPIEAIAVRAFGEYADDMQVLTDDGKPYWIPRLSPVYIDFSERRVTAIVTRANRLVPDIVTEACRAAGLPLAAIDVLVTNQPNPIFLRNWREALQVPRDAHVHTFEEHGNLFGAALPIGIERAVDTGRLRPGNHLVLGGFAHAGDYAASAVVHWYPAV